MADAKTKETTSTDVKKSNDPNHIVLSEQMKNLRRNAGIDQEVMAKRLGISRKKLSQIENCHSSVMEGFEIQLYRDCFMICRNRLPEKDRETFKQKLLRMFFF